MRTQLKAILLAGLLTNAYAEESIKEKEERELVEIKITADPLNPSLLEYSQPVSIMGKDELVIRAETTLGETIGLEPGVSTSYFGPGASRPVIRGNAGDRVKVLRNGIGTADVSNTSEDHVVTTNPLTAESIEILRGPETLLYGSTAVGGVVNVTDNSIPEEPVGEDLTGAADFRGGTGDDELTGATVLQGQVGSINLYLDGFYQDTDDIDIPGSAESSRQLELEGEEAAEGGTLENSATRSKGGTVGLSHTWDNGFVGVSLNYFDSVYGVPGHAHGHEDEHHDDHGDEHDDDHEGEDHDEDEHEDDHDDEHEDEIEELLGPDHDEEEAEGAVSLDVEQIRIDSRGRVDNVSDVIDSIKFKFAVSNYDHKELEGDEVGSTYENDAFEGRVEFLHAPISSLEGVFGIQITASDFDSEGEEAFLPQTDSLSPSVFFYEELPLNDYWTLQGGGRYEYVNLDASGFSSDDFHPFSLSTGVAYNPTGEGDYIIGFSFAYTQRAPSFTELYADGAHVARQIFEVGDSNLGKEESYGFDLNFKKNTGLVTGGLSLFFQDYSDYINLRGTGEEEDELPVFAYEDVRAMFWGFEGEVIVHLHEALDIEGHHFDFDTQVDFVRAKNESDDDDLPRIPPFRTIVGLEYGYLDLVRARIEGVFVEEQDDVAEFELPTDSYQMLNTSVELDVPMDDEFKLTLYMRGTNLNDEEARVHSSFLKDLAPLRGRSFLFGGRATF